MKGATLVTADSPAPTTYTPLLALPWWDTIGPFLTALVDDVSAELGVAPRSLYSFLTPFVLWCWQTKALDLDRRTCRAWDRERAPRAFQKSNDKCRASQHEPDYNEEAHRESRWASSL